MVIKTIYDKEREHDSLVILCTCGCDNGFIFRKLEDGLFISTINSDFYSRQENTMNKTTKLLKEMSIVLKNKRPVIKDICVNKKDVEILLEFLEEAKEYINEQYEEFNNKNTSCIKIGKDEFEEVDEDFYYISLISTKKIKEILLHGHRRFDLTLNKNEIERLIKNCKKILN